MTRAQRKLKERHGTPEEFRSAVYNVVGEISWQEAERAIVAYKMEWAKAGQKTELDDIADLIEETGK